MFEEAFENPVFWMLGGGAVTAEIIGFIYGARMGMPSFPLWQFLILLVGTVVVAAVIAGRE
jgi:hypothetical protein